MKQKEIKNITKKQKLMRGIAIFMICVLACGTGFYLGNFYISSQMKTVNYASLSEQDFLPDVKAVLARIEGKRPDQVSATDAFIAAEHYLNTAEHFVVNVEGSLTHNYGNQTVFGHKLRNAGIMEAVEISSSSAKKVANRYVAQGDLVKLYSGTVTSRTTASWSNNFKEVNFEEYRSIYGVVPSNVIPYIVSEKTVKESSSVTILAGGLYQFTLSLDAETAPMNYVQKMKKLSDLTENPTFISLEVTFVVDKNFNFVSTRSEEGYTLKFLGIPVTCSGYIQQDYDFKTIPTVRI